MKDINIEEMQKMINNENIIIIDVRLEEEYIRKHTNNAISIQLYELEDKIKRMKISKDTDILVYCKSGMKSKNASRILDDMGYINVYNLKGGFGQGKYINT